jgi:hypothetical protein
MDSPLACLDHLQVAELPGAILTPALLAGLIFPLAGTRVALDTVQCRTQSPLHINLLVTSEPGHDGHYSAWTQWSLQSLAR